MAGADPQVVRAVTAHRSALAQVRGQVELFVTRAWGSLDAWRDADIARFAGAVVPVVLGGQRRVAALTDSYLATIASQVLGGSARPVGVRADRVTGAAVRGVDPREVYRRPGITVWNALSKGSPLQQAVRLGATRALVLAVTDLQLAQTHTARAVFAADGRVAGQRRITSGSPCPLCAQAATQRYGASDLMPIHDRCSCSVEPIYGAADPGPVTEPAVPEGPPPLEVADHGEVGPTLVDAGHAFTGPGDL